VAVPPFSALSDNPGSEDDEGKSSRRRRAPRAPHRTPGPDGPGVARHGTV